MTNLSFRQKDILRKLIEEYIETAIPVSSNLLSDKYDFGISPAMIRIELGRLSDDDYIYQPHISSGRVPTDRGYRFFVDEMEEAEEELDIQEMNLIDQDFWQKISELNRFLAETCSIFAISGLPHKNFFSESGWSRILEEPEFRNTDLPLRFAKLVRVIEREIRDWDTEEEAQVFIGSENPFGDFEDFSILLAKCRFKEGKGIISLLGPKRMSYKRNIGVIKRLKNWIEQRL